MRFADVAFGSFRFRFRRTSNMRLVKNQIPAPARRLLKTFDLRTSTVDTEELANVLSAAVVLEF